MTAALIGLVGVVAGGLLGGITSLGVARSQRRMTAYTAGRLVEAELDTVIRRLETSIEDASDGAAKRWAGDLPTDAWRDQAANLAAYNVARYNLRAFFSVRGDDNDSPDLLSRLSLTYASIDRLNVDKKINLDPTTLTEDVAGFRVTRSTLDRYANRIKRQKLTPARLTVGFVTVGLVLVALLFPSPDVTSNSVAAELTSSLGRNQVVHCDPAGTEAWNCVDYSLSDTAVDSQCQSAVSGQDSRLRLSAANFSCSAQSASSSYNVELAGSRLLATPSPASAERRTIAKTLSDPEPRDGFLERFLTWFFG